jgi:hypothetical protein
VETPTGNALFDVEETTASVYAVGGGARVYDRDAERWSADATPTGENLKAVVVLGGRRRRRDRAQTLGTPLAFRRKVTTLARSGIGARSDTAGRYVSERTAVST